MTAEREGKADRSYASYTGSSAPGAPAPALPRPGMGGGAGFGGGPGRRFMSEASKARDARGTVARIWRYLKKYKAMLWLVFVLALTGSAVSLVGPYMIGEAVDAMKGGPGRVDFDGLARIGATLVTVYLLGALASWLTIFYMSDIAQRTVKDIRRDLFAKVQSIPVSYFDKRPHGELMSRLVNDVDNVNNTLSQGVTQAFSSAVTVFGSLAMMLWLSPLLTVLSLAAIPLSILLTSAIAKRTRRYFSRQARDLGELNGFIEENISGQKVVKAYGREKGLEEEFSAISERLRRSGLMAQIYSGMVPRIMIVVNNLSYALVSAAGGMLVIRGAVTVGLVASFLSYSRQFARPINEIANQFNQLQSAVAGAERVFEVLDEKDEGSEGEQGFAPDCVRGDVKFEDVDFSYEKGVPVLRDIDIRADEGRTVAIVGPTGAGKTTIVNLLMRFYDVDGGAVEVDGRDIRSLDRDALRSSIGIVLQDTYLFSETVRENIRYGRLDATDAEIERAARMANADAFIRRLPDGYDTVLGEDGGNLSQGQRQLIAIARAILADPSILILDEATSSVDTRTEVHIQRAMLDLMKGRTSIVIAHRLSTIKGADEILVLRDGRIVERGTHAQLMEAKGFYHSLYAGQFRRHEALTAGI
ncbi:MAG TPA: ABC transporter ATP-binding protein [Bacillota bacterium]|nr:ABC transporter ATP-binding protein [Bacillota bacterium]